MIVCEDGYKFSDNSERNAIDCGTTGKWSTTPDCIGTYQISILVRARILSHSCMHHWYVYVIKVAQIQIQLQILSTNVFKLLLILEALRM